MGFHLTCHFLHAAISAVSIRIEHRSKSNTINPHSNGWIKTPLHPTILFQPLLVAFLSLGRISDDLIFILWFSIVKNQLEKTWLNSWLDNYWLIISQPFLVEFFQFIHRWISVDVVKIPFQMKRFNGWLTAVPSSLSNFQSFKQIPEKKKKNSVKLMNSENIERLFKSQCRTLTNEKWKLVQCLLLVRPHFNADWPHDLHLDGLPFNPFDSPTSSTIKETQRSSKKLKYEA